nr:cupin domain-containing protein [Allomuricauda sp.]|tara:strand:- start:1482 stop:1865 length:384 start_codon:yes stop_codon:yes gene_type:complete
MKEYRKTNCKTEATKLSNSFSPKIVAELNDHFIKVVKIKGEKVPWHHHDNSDELFYVLDGELIMEIESQPAFTLKAGELYVVKKNVEHRVFSQEECKLMLIEHKETIHTGNVKSEITKTIEQQTNQT